MSTYLVVAHRTLVGQHLLDHVRSLSDGAGTADTGGSAQGTESGTPIRFHLVVPVTHPRDHAWTEGEVEGAARRRLDEGLAAFAAIGAEATGEVGDANPVYAATTALRTIPPVDGIVVSTLPRGVSRWLHLDVVHRLRREVEGLEVTHVEAVPAESSG